MNSRILVVTSAKGNKERRRPCIKLGGFWLNEIGFNYNKLMTIQCSEKNIILKLCDKGSINHFELSKKILKEYSKGIFHVGHEWRKTGSVPIISVKGFWLEKFGFKVGGVLVVSYDDGIINIRLLELEGLSNAQI